MRVQEILIIALFIIVVFLDKFLNNAILLAMGLITVIAIRLLNKQDIARRVAIAEKPKNR